MMTKKQRYKDAQTNVIGGPLNKLTLCYTTNDSVVICFLELR